MPTKVLQKTGPLTEEELAAIQLHPMRGLEIVRQIGFLTEALDGIMHHHERMDGKGYPMGLAGDEIPEFARVIAVADAFDSMTSTRSYRRRPERRGGRRGAAQMLRHAVRSGARGRLHRRAGPGTLGVAGGGRVAAWPLPADSPPRSRPRITTTPPRRCGSSRAAEAARGDDATAPGPPVRLAVHRLGQLLLVAAAGVLLVAAVAQTAAVGWCSRRDALAFGALIALGELLRLSLPGDREAAPIGSAGALGYALACPAVGTCPALQPALQVVAVTAVGMIVGALPHLAAGRPAGVAGMASRLLAVAFVAIAFRPLAHLALIDHHVWLRLAVMAVLIVAGWLAECVIKGLIRADALQARFIVSLADELRIQVPLGAAVGASAMLIALPPRPWGWWRWRCSSRRCWSPRPRSAGTPASAPPTCRRSAPWPGSPRSAATSRTATPTGWAGSPSRSAASSA